MLVGDSCVETTCAVVRDLEGPTEDAAVIMAGNSCEFCVGTTRAVVRDLEGPTEDAAAVIMGMVVAATSARRQDRMLFTTFLYTLHTPSSLYHEAKVLVCKQAAFTFIT